MIYRLLGAGLIVIGCGGTGFWVANNAKKETRSLKNLIVLLEFWKSELSFKLTPLPELCKQAANFDSGILGRFWNQVASELDGQISPNAEACIDTALEKCPELPELCKSIIQMLSKSLGRFDLDGQLRGIESALIDAQRVYEHHITNQEVQLRSYRTLGICAGAALAILFI